MLFIYNIFFWFQLRLVECLVYFSVVVSLVSWRFYISSALEYSCIVKKQKSRWSENNFVCTQLRRVMFLLIYLFAVVVYSVY